MLGKTKTLDLNLLLATVSASDPLRDEISLIFSTIHKRSNFSALHYHEFKKCLADNRLEMERAGISFTDVGMIHDNRVHYEANIFAFSQNLHAICDSFPYVVMCLLGPLTYTDKKTKQKWILTNKQCGWNDIFFKAIAETVPQLTAFLKRLHHFSKIKEFLILKGLVNQCKHQHIPRVLNQYASLHFESIEYSDEKNKKCKIENLDADLMMNTWHNRLFLRLFLLYIHLYRARVLLLSSPPSC